MPTEKWNAQRFRLNFVPEGPPPRVRVHQYTVGSVMELHGEIFYGTEPIDMQYSMGEWFSEDVDQNGSVTFAFRRGDGKKFQYKMEDPHDALYADDNIFYFPLDAKMTAAAGPCVMSLGFDDGSGGNVLWTQNFIIDVEPAPVRDTDLDRNIDDPTIEDVIRTNVTSAVNAMKAAMVEELSDYVDSEISSMESGVSERLDQKMTELGDTLAERLADQITAAKLEEAVAAQDMIDDLAFDVDSSDYLILYKG